MGKKSRRKKNDAKSLKERQVERRERVISNLEGDDNAHDDENVNSENHKTFSAMLFVGDRVWYPGSGEYALQGIIKAMGEGEGATAEILPLEAPDREEFYVTENVDKLVRARCEWTTKYHVGDKIIFFDDTPSRRFYVEATFAGLVKSNHIDSPESFLIALVGGDGMMLSFNEREDQEWLSVPESFRFSIGDKVVFSTHLAWNVRRMKELWANGEITEVHILGRDDVYAAYECVYTWNRKRLHCYILDDNDEYVASPSTSTRQRLLDAIQQNCSFKHIDHLVVSSGIDVASIQDLFLNAAIEAGSYDALLWLQDRLGVKLDAVSDGSGNGLLHMICRSPNASRFFEEVNAQGNGSNGTYEAQIHLDRPYNPLTYHKNALGRHWVYELVMRKDLHALELILSPYLYFGWTVLLRCAAHGKEFLLQEIGDMLEAENVVLGARMMAEFIYLVSCRNLYICHQGVQFFHDKTNDDVFSRKVLVATQEETPVLVAARLARFSCDKHRDLGQQGKDVHALDELIQECCQLGSITSLRYLTESGVHLTAIRRGSRMTEVDQGEFIQPELLKLRAEEIKSTESAWEDLDLVGLAVHGLRHFFIRGDGEVDEYTRFLSHYRSDRGFQCYVESAPLLDKLSEHLSRYKSHYCDLLKKRLLLIQDDESLQLRLQILDFLVDTQGFNPPSCIDTIRWRQCGVLRWLVDHEHVQLTNNARLETNLCGSGTIPTCLGGRSIPDRLVVQDYLLFLAVEYDDLQCLLWLVAEVGVGLAAARLHGWNVAHACAFFGRTEIVLELMRVRPTEWLALNQEQCLRAPYENRYSVYIAIDRGFVFVADWLLVARCPGIDSHGKGIVDHALRSKYEFVRNWGKKKARPLALERDITKLYCLLDVESPNFIDIKHFLASSRCLDFTTWEGASFYSANVAGPLGNTYLEILLDCVRVAELDFVAWLLRYVTPVEDGWGRAEHKWLMFWDVTNSFGAANIQEIGNEDLRLFAEETHNSTLASWLTESWANDVKCSDPDRNNPLLSLLFRHFSANTRLIALLRSFRNEQLLRSCLHRLRDRVELSLKLLFEHGAASDIVNERFSCLDVLSVTLSEQLGGKIDEIYNEYEIVCAPGTVNLACDVAVQKESLTSFSVFVGKLVRKINYDFF